MLEISLGKDNNQMRCTLNIAQCYFYKFSKWFRILEELARSNTNFFVFVTHIKSYRI